MTERGEHVYDLFISYAESDRAWVEGYLLDALTRAGVDYHSEAAFALGVPRLLEFERAVQERARTLLVLSPAYLAEHFGQFVDVLAQSYGLETATWPVIPLLLHSVDLPPRLAMLTALDATGEGDWEPVVERLCTELERPAPGPAPKPPCPYPGMVPFREADSAGFFGRDATAAPIVLRGQWGAICAVAISPDNRWLVTGSRDNTARLWDLTAEDPPAAAPIVLRGHDDDITAVAISPDSHWLVTGSGDATARLWDLTVPDPAAEPILLRGHRGPIWDAAISPDSHWLVTGSGDGTARLWNLRLDELMDLACRTAGRNLTLEEREQYFPGQAYRRTCPNLPPGAGAPEG